MHNVAVCKIKFTREGHKWSDTVNNWCSTLLYKSQAEV